MMRHSMLLSFVLLFVLLLPLHARAAITLPSVFSDHMVLQRDAVVPIWGNAEPGENLTIRFGDRVLSTKADKDGAWRIELKPLDTSKKPQTLTIQADNSKKKTVFKNVLVGDVWVGSGQSNMAGRVASYTKNDETLAALVKNAPFPNIHLLLGGPKPKWSEATPQSVLSFSAIHFAFGERLQRDLNVPVGLIVGAVGGTPSGYWIPPATFAGSKKCKAVIAEFKET